MIKRVFSSNRKGAIDVLADELRDFGGKKMMIPSMNHLFPFDPFKSQFMPEKMLFPIAQHSILCDLKETKDAFNFAFEVPGVKKQDLHLSIQDQTLQLTAERETSKTESGDDFIKMERFSGTSYRSISLPSTADIHKDITAKMENGVLNVKIHKIPAEQGKTDNKLNIEIK